MIAALDFIKIGNCEKYRKKNKKNNYSREYGTIRSKEVHNIRRE